jgi:hypothetical protein
MLFSFFWRNKRMLYNLGPSHICRHIPWIKTPAVSCRVRQACCRRGLGAIGDPPTPMVGSSLPDSPRLVVSNFKHFVYLTYWDPNWLVFFRQVKTTNQFLQTPEKDWNMDWLKRTSNAETMDSPMKYRGSCRFSFQPIHWFSIADSRDGQLHFDFLLWKDFVRRVHKARTMALKMGYVPKMRILNYFNEIRMMNLRI